MTGDTNQNRHAGKCLKMPESAKKWHFQAFLGTFRHVLKHFLETLVGGALTLRKFCLFKGRIDDFSQFGYKSQEPWQLVD